MFKNWLSKLAITIPLGWLFSHFFMWSNNAHMFTNMAFFYSSIVILVIAIVLYFLGVLWLKLSDMMPEKYKKTIDIVNSILFAGTFSLIVGVFLMEPVLDPTPVKLPLLILFIVICFGIYFAKSLLNTMLCVMLIFSTVIFGYNLISLNLNANNNGSSG